MRVRKAGFRIGYAPHAVAYHELSPQRYGREYNRRVQYRKGMSRSIPTRLDPISSDSQPGGQLLSIWTLLLVGKDTESVQDRRSNHEVLGVSDGESARCELQKFFVLDLGDVRISLSLLILPVRYRDIWGNGRHAQSFSHHCYVQPRGIFVGDP